jgi:hypothetical protein
VHAFTNPKVLAGILLILPFWQSAHAWNAEGHMVVAQIAYNHLNPDVKAKCDALISIPVFNAGNNNSNFVTAACWADDIKSFTSAYSIWHYIDIPFSPDNTPTSGVGAGSFDVVRAINQCIATLQSPSATMSNQAVSLRFLLHFVGDIQQPLHCSTCVTASDTNGDDGGNGFSVNGSWSNLHSLWDAGGGYLTDSVGRPLNATRQTTLNNKVADVEAAYPFVGNPGTIPDPMSWALEGWQLASNVCYVGITNATTPTSGYLNTAMATTRQRMAQGGKRLADLLNTIAIAPPTVSAQPSTTNLTYGTSVTITASAAGGNPLAIQWYDYLTNSIVGATNTFLALTNPTVAVSGNYTVIVTNASGRASNRVAVAVSPAPLTVTANNRTNESGTPLVFVGTEFTASGLLSPDTVTNVTLFADGSGSIIPTNAMGSGLANYNIAYVPGTLTTVDTNPALVTMQGTAGGIAFGFSNLPGASFTVFGTTNVTLPITAWSNLGHAVEVPAGSGLFQFTDADWSSQEQRFYRVRSP